MYTERFGVGVRESHVLDIDPANERATSSWTSLGPTRCRTTRSTASSSPRRCSTSTTCGPPCPMPIASCARAACSSAPCPASRESSLDAWRTSAGDSRPRRAGVSSGRRSKTATCHRVAWQRAHLDRLPGGHRPAGASQGPAPPLRRVLPPDSDHPGGEGGPMHRLERLAGERWDAPRKAQEPDHSPAIACSRPNEAAERYLGRRPRKPDRPLLHRALPRPRTGKPSGEACSRSSSRCTPSASASGCASATCSTSTRRTQRATIIADLARADVGARRLLRLLHPHPDAAVRLRPAGGRVPLPSHPAAGRRAARAPCRRCRGSTPARLENEYWRFTAASCKRLFGEAFDGGDVVVELARQRPRLCRLPRRDRCGGARGAATRSQRRILPAAS